MVELLRDLNEAQARLYLSLSRFLMAYKAPDLQNLIDEDVESAARALASTYRTAAKGVLYDHPANSLPAERLTRELKSFLSEVRQHSAPASDQECAAVLERLADAVAAERAGLAQPVQGRGYLAFVERVLGKGEPDSGDGHVSSDERSGGPRLILP